MDPANKYRVTEIFSQPSPADVVGSTSAENKIPPRNQAEAQLKNIPSSTKEGVSFKDFKAALITATGTTLISIGLAGSVLLAPLTIAGTILGAAAGYLAQQAGSTKNWEDVALAGAVVGSLGMAGLIVVGFKMEGYGSAKQEESKTNNPNKPVPTAEESHSIIASNEHIESLKQETSTRGALANDLEKQELKETQTEFQKLATKMEEYVAVKHKKSKTNKLDKSTSAAESQSVIASEHENINLIKKEAANPWGGFARESHEEQEFKEKVNEFKNLLAKYESLGTIEEKRNFLKEEKTEDSLSFPDLKRIHSCYERMEPHQANLRDLDAKTKVAENKSNTIESETAAKILETPEKQESIVPPKADFISLSDIKKTQPKKLRNSEGSNNAVSRDEILSAIKSIQKELKDIALMKEKAENAVEHAKSEQSHNSYEKISYKAAMETIIRDQGIISDIKNANKNDPFFNKLVEAYENLSPLAKKEEFLTKNKDHQLFPILSKIHESNKSIEEQQNEIKTKDYLSKIEAFDREQTKNQINLSEAEKNLTAIENKKDQAETNLQGLKSKLEDLNIQSGISQKLESYKGFKNSEIIPRLENEIQNQTRFMNSLNQTEPDYPGQLRSKQKTIAALEEKVKELKAEPEKATKDAVIQKSETSDSKPTVNIKANRDLLFEKFNKDIEDLQL